MAVSPIDWEHIIQEDMVETSNVSHMVVYDMITKVRLSGTKGYWLPEADLDMCFDVFKNPERYLIDGFVLWKGMPCECTFLVCKADSRSFYCKRGPTSCFGARSMAGTFVLLFAEPPVLPGRTANALELLIDYLNEYETET